MKWDHIGGEVYTCRVGRYKLIIAGCSKDCTAGCGMYLYQTRTDEVIRSRPLGNNKRAAFEKAKSLLEDWLPLEMAIVDGSNKSM